MIVVLALAAACSSQAPASQPACGNGVVDVGETCDPPGSCPSSCNDGNACTIDGSMGNAAACTFSCTHTAVAACANGDGCCPAGCNANTDNDCSATCGNGTIESGEICDPPGMCPTSCSDGNACTVDGSTGSAANCNLACTHNAITSCGSDDSCCPAGCDANSDRDCSATCGNGTVEPGETCDPPGTCPGSCSDGNACTTDGTVGSATNCNLACTHTAIVTCASGDGCCPAGCNANSDSDCSPTCGNGTIETGETCDPPGSCPQSCADTNACTIDGSTGSAANCNLACSHAPIVTCANGDGCCPNGCNANTDTDCSATCGNGTIEAGETCDPPSSCPTSCADANTCTIDTLLGSAATCNVACVHQTIVSCNNGDGCCPLGCNANNDNDCAAVCGNNILEPGELCDGSDCPTTCNDANACTTDGQSGSPGSCNLSCSYALVSACQSGDGCCPQSCTPANDGDCSGATWQSEIATERAKSFVHPEIACSNALRVAGNGDVYITYFNDGDPNAPNPRPEMRVARRQGSTWSTELVVNRLAIPVPGKHSLTIDGAGVPHACHLATAGPFAVFHDVRSASGWTSEVAGLGTFSYLFNDQACSIATDPGNNLPRIAYLREMNSGTRTAFVEYVNRLSDGTWAENHVVFPGAGDPGYPALALDPAGRPHISYGLRSQATIRTRGYVFRDATNQFVFAGPPNQYAPAAMVQSAIAVDAGGAANIVYFTPSDRSVTFARRVGGAWQLQMIDPGPVEGDVALVLDASGRGHVAYQRDAHTIMYARRTSQSWDLQAVATDAALTSGSGCIGIAVDAAGVAHVSYIDTATFPHLRYATRTP